MVGSGQDQEKSIGSQCQDQFLFLERRRDREVSVHTMHTSRSQSQGRSYISHEENTRSMQLEIDCLRRRLRRDQRRRTPLDSDPSSNDDGDGSYRPKSRTPPSMWCPNFDWLCNMYWCMMSLTSDIYWVDLGFIKNYKESQLWLVLLRYSANKASVFPWVVTYGIRADSITPYGLRDNTSQSGPKWGR